MMENFAVYIQKKTKTPYLHDERRIRYVITFLYDLQELSISLSDVSHMSSISRCKLLSRAIQPYNPAKPNEHFADADALICDEVQ